MSKPYIHALSSAKKYGGKPEDYEKIHEWFDQTKSFLPDQRHRAILHSSFGIFLCSQVFGNTLKNSDGKVVSVRDIGEQHVLEDFGGKFIPTPQDYLQELEYKDWMQNGKSYPPSFDKIRSQRKPRSSKPLEQLVEEKAEAKAPKYEETSKWEVPAPNASYAFTDGSLPGSRLYFPQTPIIPAKDVVFDGSMGGNRCLPGEDVVVDGSRDVIERNQQKLID